MQFANARSDRLMLAPSLSFCPKLFVSEALSLLTECSIRSAFYKKKLVLTETNE